MAAHQEEGWPLGLQPLNVRVGLERARNYFGSMSFNTTMLTGSPTSSTDFSSDLDTESTGSFFHDRSITLGSLIGVSSILELSRRSIRGARRAEPLKIKKPGKAKPWIFSLCSRDSINVKSSTTNTPSLGQFLAVERRAANNESRRSQSHNLDVPDEISMAQPTAQPNSLFVDGRVAPPQSSPQFGSEGESSHSGGIDHGNSNGNFIRPGTMDKKLLLGRYVIELLNIAFPFDKNANIVNGSPHITLTSTTANLRHCQQCHHRISALIQHHNAPKTKETFNGKNEHSTPTTTTGAG